MFGECHAHIFMDGIDYRAAVRTHRDAPCEPVIRAHLKEYQMRGITYVRDGGDKYGASTLARKLAPEYGITYRTPVFGIHKNGQYGKIVGYGFSDMREYHDLVKQAISQGADFIKIMTTGLMDFDDHGAVTGEPSEKRASVRMRTMQRLSWQVTSWARRFWGLPTISRATRVS